jgi:Leucine-rich repeat (LRR) protein
MKVMKRNRAWCACIAFSLLAIPIPGALCTHPKGVKANTSYETAKSITLVFPRTAVGKYCLMKPGTSYISDQQVSEYMPAKGPADIPANTRISLKLGYSVHGNTALLKSIPAQAVRYLDLSKLEIDNAEFQDLLHFTDLVSLDMNSTDVNDRGTHGLRNLTKLQNLNVNFCSIGPGTVEEISYLKDLIRLTFNSSTLGDKVGPMLAKLKKLQVLELSATVMTDSCVKDISTLSELQELGLARNNVTDKCIDSILKMTRLQRLNLSDTKVTFAGLMRLHQLPKLKNLLLRKSQLSQGQLDQLQKSLPKVCLEEGTKAKVFAPDLFAPLH